MSRENILTKYTLLHWIIRIPLHDQKISTPDGVEIFWRSSRDSNPGDAFTPYEISRHASSTSLSTAP